MPLGRRQQHQDDALTGSALLSQLVGVGQNFENFFSKFGLAVLQKKFREIWAETEIAFISRSFGVALLWCSILCVRGG